MVWDRSQPTDNTKLRLAPGVIRPNWDALETGGVPFDMLRLEEQAGNPTRVDNRGFIFAKQGSSGFTELYYLNDNNPADVTQLTSGAVAQLVPTAPTLNANSGRVYLPGGLLMQWGNASFAAVATSSPTFSTAFTTVYTVTGTTSVGDRKFAITAITNAGFTWASESAATGVVRYIAIGLA